MEVAKQERDAQFKVLIDLLHSVPHDIFNGFDITRAHFKSAGVEIGVDILIPKRKSTTARPVIVRIHGGFLVSAIVRVLITQTYKAIQITGSSLFPAWFSKWILDFADEHDAIILSPNYRLLPEVKGKDIIQDMANFWTWVQSGGPGRHLASAGRSSVAMNLAQTLLVGESAGKIIAFYFSSCVG
jgi:acetyl esterase/lipase